MLFILKALSLAKTPRRLNVIHVMRDTTSSYVIDFKCALEFGERQAIDSLFANAGTGEFGPLGAITEEHFDKTFNANVKGLLFSVQKALPLLKDGSSIILNASIVSSTGSPALSVYSASKAVVRSFARTFTSAKRPQNPCEGCESWRDSFSGLTCSLRG
jgi:NAD(P)-dependent dehydrogenase (short-subunit alcohol dehydrogenase family)